MDFHKKTWFIGLVLLLLIFTGFLVFIRSPQKGKIISIAMQTGDSSQEITGFTYLRFKGNMEEWKIDAASASIHQNKTILSDIKASYLLPDHTILKIYADRGIYDRKKDIFFAEKISHDINVYIDNTFNIITNNLIWTGNKIYGKGMVYVKGKDFFLQGKVLKGSIREGIYEIENDIKAFLW